MKVEGFKRETTEIMVFVKEVTRFRIMYTLYISEIQQCRFSLRSHVEKYKLEESLKIWNGISL